MERILTAVYDANILDPAPLRDLFLRVAQAGLVRARWTDQIHDEWLRNLLKDNPKLSVERLARTRTLMTAEELLATLESHGLVHTVARLREFLDVL